MQSIIPCVLFQASSVLGDAFLLHSGSELLQSNVFCPGAIFVAAVCVEGL